MHEDSENLIKEIIRFEGLDNVKKFVDGLAVEKKNFYDDLREIDEVLFDDKDKIVDSYDHSGNI